MRLATRLSISLGSPAVTAGVRCSARSMPVRRRLVAAGGEHSCRRSSEVEGVPAGDAALAGGQGEQRFDEPFLVPAESEGLLAGRAQGVGVGVGVGEGDLRAGCAGRRAGCAARGRRWRRSGAGRRRRLQAGEQVVEGVGRVRSARPSGSPRSRRRWRFPAEMFLAVAVMARSGRRNRPATYQPRARATGIRTTSATADPREELGQADPGPVSGIAPVRTRPLGVAAGCWRAGRRRGRARRSRRRRCPPRRRARAASAGTFWSSVGRS